MAKSFAILMPLSVLLLLPSLSPPELMAMDFLHGMPLFAPVLAFGSQLLARLVRDIAGLQVSSNQGIPVAVRRTA
jgi:hypothetical protein